MIPAPGNRIVTEIDLKKDGNDIVTLGDEVVLKTGLLNKYVMGPLRKAKTYRRISDVTAINKTLSYELLRFVFLIIR